MKNKDLKKGKESIIGKIIYGFLLFMPLLAIFSTILINTFNMNAKQETKIIYKYETNEVNSFEDLKSGNIYKLQLILENETISNNITLCRADAIFEIPYYNIEIDNITTDTNDIITISVRKDYPSILYIKNGSTTYLSTNFVNYTDNYCYVVLHDTNNIYDYTLFSKSDFNIFDKVETTNIDAQEIFYDSIAKVEDSELFNWAENSLIYTGIADTCTQLSITNTFIPLLLAYWLIISVIYILYDIILMILIILHNKIHQIQDSI